jgi:hypothetical protein
MDLCRVWKETTNWTARIDVQSQHMGLLKFALTRQVFACFTACLPRQCELNTCVEGIG